MIRYQCARCGHLTNGGAEICPFCGARGSLFPRRERGRTAAFFSVFLWILLILGSVFILRMLLFRSYARDLDTAESKVLAGASAAREAGERILAVWSHSLSRTEDAETDRFTRADGGAGAFFSDPRRALDLLEADPLFRARLQTLTEGGEELAVLMRRLSAPPARYREEYRRLREQYAAYLDLAETILRPRESLPAFAEAFRAADEAFSQRLSGPAAALPDA